MSTKEIIAYYAEHPEQDPRNQETSHDRPCSLLQHLRVGSDIRVICGGRDCGEAVVSAKENPATDQIIRFKYLDPFPHPHVSINKHRRDFVSSPG